MNQSIASILKQLRKSSNLSVRQAACQLKHYGIDIASKTLYGYESGLSMPNADVFVALCKIYHCNDPSELTEYAPPENISFSPDELSLVNDYQELDPFGQDIVRQIIEHEKERIRQMKHLNSSEESQDAGAPGFLPDAAGEKTS